MALLFSVLGRILTLLSVMTFLVDEAYAQGRPSLDWSSLLWYLGAVVLLLLLVGLLLWYCLWYVPSQTRPRTPLLPIRAEKPDPVRSQLEQKANKSERTTGTSSTVTTGSKSTVTTGVSLSSVGTDRQAAKMHPKEEFDSAMLDQGNGVPVMGEHLVKGDGVAAIKRSPLTNFYSMRKFLNEKEREKVNDLGEHEDGHTGKLANLYLDQAKHGQAGRKRKD